MATTPKEATVQSLPGQSADDENMMYVVFLICNVCVQYVSFIERKRKQNILPAKENLSILAKFTHSVKS